MTKRFSFLHILSSLIFAGALACTADLASAFFSVHIPFVSFILIFVVTALLLIGLRMSTKWLWLFYFAAVIAALVFLGAVLFGFNTKAAYLSEDNGKAELYGGKKVLVLVPHQDDELLAAGGVIEEYVKYGSDVYLSFYANGDNVVPGEVRLREALAVAEAMGIGSEQVVFLGYGDNLCQGLHVYNMQETELVSKNGRSHTYALTEHPPYRQSEYKRENIVADIKDLLLELRADIVICTEFEEHPDHAALSLFFDEAMEQILKSEGNDYQPIVLKSPAYANYFYGVEDFYSYNLPSTVPALEGYSTGIYAWEDRLRLPVNGSGLSHSLYGCDTYKQFRLHKSQRIPQKAEGSINGDKVFWIRDTHSLSYRADIQVSSGNGSFLNNFKLVDNYDILSVPMDLSGCTWIPDDSDSSKTADVILEEPAYIHTIRLYDDPHKDVNVLNALITFDDGSSMETGALNISTATDIAVNKDNVASFSVQLLETEGEGAGLTEIEFYGRERDYGFKFIKLTDMNGNFVYDYYVKKDAPEKLRIYAPGVDESIHIEHVVRKSNGQEERGISYNFKNGQTVNISCGKDETLILTARSESGLYSDTVVISNPARFMRETGPGIEQLFRQFFNGNMQQSNCYTMLKTVLSMI